MAIKNSKTFTRYNCQWDASVSALEIEFYAIRQGGKWKNHRGQECGEGLFQHYRNAQSLCWPEDDHHRWSDLVLKGFCENDITVMLGSSDAGKTYEMSRFALIDYWAFPEETLWLVSSTDRRGAELRIWGKVKELYNRAKKRFPNLSGNVLESMMAITTESISDDHSLARSLQKGFIVVPCKQGNVFVGLSGFIGIKSPRLRHAGDEVQLMSPNFLDAYANFAKASFKGVMAGNPLDPTDPLCRAAEPEDGWDNWIDTGKTQEWRSKFFGAHVIALDGRDSPNFDYPADQPPKFPYLIGPKKLNAIAKTFGPESWQWFNQGVGKPNSKLVLWRVITRQICKDNLAHDPAQWEGTSRTLVYSLDPAYGGGDRCIAGPIEFGMGLDGKQMIKVHPTELVPIKLTLAKEPEEQIVDYIKLRLTQLNIAPDHCFYDSFGKGTLGYFFAKQFGNQTPVPVDSGAQPTERPVRYDLFVEEDGKKRLKRCDEHYSKFVTELWFSVAEVIQGQQMRELPLDVMDEGCARIYRVVKGSKIEIESKDDFKERLGYSPDKFDWLAVAVEGARRLGFKIQRLGIAPTEEVEDDVVDEEAAEYQIMLNSKLLDHAA